jgi:hypothetical protein
MFGLENLYLLEDRYACSSVVGTLSWILRKLDAAYHIV